MSAIAERNAALRRGLATASPPVFWRSLDELAGSADFQRYLDAEFPNLGRRLEGAPDRRTMLKLMGAALLMGGLAACHPARQIVPYVRQPEDLVPGRKTYYATTLSIDGCGFGVLAESHEGRPTKIEGNPAHPASLGATDAILQAAVLGLYDPDRAREPTKDRIAAGYDQFLAEVADLRTRLVPAGGKGLALLIGAETSPTLTAGLAALRQQFPQLQVYRHAPLATPDEARATEVVFGRPLTPVYHLDRARVILSLDADFLGEGAGKLAYARQFADARRVTATDSTMSRLYAFASTPTLVSAKADHFRRLKASRMGEVVAALEARLDQRPSTTDPVDGHVLDMLAADLRAAGAAALVMAGPRLDAATQAAVHRLNARLGALGHTVDFIEPLEVEAAAGDVYALGEAVGHGEVEALFVLGGDPLYSAPTDAELGSAFKQVPFTAYWGLYADATAVACHWHIPAAHELESWSDGAAFDGTLSIVQPLIAPLYGGRTIHEVVAAISGVFDQDALALVKNHWNGAGGLNETSWAEALKTGLVSGSAAKPVVAALTGSTAPSPHAPARQPGLELNLVPDPYFRDGAFSGNAWLNELPRPLSKIVWGNAVQLSAATAAGLGLAAGDVAEITAGDQKLEAPVWIEPGQPDDSITLTLGFGRQTGASGPVGINGYALRRRDALWRVGDVRVGRTGRKQEPITTQHHFAMEGRDVVRTATLADFEKDPAVLARNTPPEPGPDDTLFPKWAYDQEAWGMTIDTGTCIGCMACVSACQAENNSPVVGPDQVALGREMHWLRVDRYYSGDPAEPETHFQPVPCMQCEDAPCEEVCPVNATVHTHDGLNAQVYNRCVGTRYCSQNCPYKVRRFNFLEYQDFSEDAPLAPLRNPNVSVRERGVMEKCTYCVQRISAARIDAQDAERPIGDGEIKTACQQACPTKAITFGNLNDPRSEVNRVKREPHNYVLLAELNTHPRTSYLAEIRNPHTDSEEEPVVPSNG